MNGGSGSSHPHLATPLRDIPLLLVHLSASRCLHSQGSKSPPQYLISNLCSYNASDRKLTTSQAGLFHFKTILKLQKLFLK